MELQIICRRTDLESLKKVVEEVSPDTKIQECRDHFRLSEFPTEDSKELLLECRKVSYSYLRIVEWEKGGGFTLEGRAQCVAGLYGEKLDPLLVRDKGDRVCGHHALFGSRKGIVVCTVVRFKDSIDLQVEKHVFEKLEYVGPSNLLTVEINVSDPDQDLTEVKELSERLKEIDPYLDLIKATVRKSFCSHCVCVHYRRYGQYEQYSSSSRVLQEGAGRSEKGT